MRLQLTLNDSLIILLECRNENGDGDTLTRDANMIFPPNTTHFYKPVHVKASTYLDKKTGIRQQRNEYSYVTSRERPNHPEELRWRWWYREYKNAEIPS